MGTLRIVLASGSPRRGELLRRVWPEFDIIPSSASEEPWREGRSPVDLAMDNALAKARDVARSRPGDLVIGADTVVVLDERVLGKPSDVDGAWRMLRSLSGKTHQVVTGVALVHLGSGTELVDFEMTDVTFKDLSDEAIDRYIKELVPLDKAGAYGIQEIGDSFVENIEGDYDNVVGLPMELLISMFDDATDMIHGNLTKT